MIARHSLTGLNIIIFHDGLIFYTAIIINSKNWRITVKLHFENLSIFFSKNEHTQMLGIPPPFRLFIFVRFSMTPSPLQRTYFLMDDNKINFLLPNLGTDWITFSKNPPAASHMGVVWKRHHVEIYYHQY